MVTLKDYMWKVDGSSFSFESIVTAKEPLIINGAELHVTVHFNLGTNTLLLSWYIPCSTNPVDTIKQALNSTNKIIQDAKRVNVTIPTQAQSSFSSKDLIFTGRVFINTDENLNNDEEVELINFAKQSNINPVFRGANYLTSINQSPLAFISHSSLDKDLIARPIAEGLSKLSCPVWYDEYSLKVGDHLRESIEKGIKDCNKCIVIISPNYLNNVGWGKSEFNAVFTKEIINHGDYILPVWQNVTIKDVYEYSPSMANRMALDWDKLGSNTVISKLNSAIQQKKV